MTDIEITQDNELMVAHAEGVTDQGIDFLDSYMAPLVEVVDSGRLIIPQDGLAPFTEAAQAEGLKVGEA